MQKKNKPSLQLSLETRSCSYVVVRKLGKDLHQPSHHFKPHSQLARPSAIEFLSQKIKNILNTKVYHPRQMPTIFPLSVRMLRDQMSRFKGNLKTIRIKHDTSAVGFISNITQIARKATNINRGIFNGLENLKKSLT